jgi:PAS domain S-box-containing protein
MHNALAHRLLHDCLASPVERRRARGMDAVRGYGLDADGESLLASIRVSPIAAVISDPRLPLNPIVAVNDAFCQLTGYPVDEIIGRNCKFLAGPATEPWLTERISAGVREHRPVLVEILNYKRDRTPFRNAVLVAPVFDVEGELEYFLGSQVELPDDAVGPLSARHAHAVSVVKTLSPRQREILERIAAGYRSKQIAWQLSLSEKTVKMHRSLMFQKLGTANIADAIRIAVEAGL